MLTIALLLTLSVSPEVCPELARAEAAVNEAQRVAYNERDLVSGAIASQMVASAVAQLEAARSYCDVAPPTDPTAEDVGDPWQGDSVPAEPSPDLQAAAAVLGVEATQEAVDGAMAKAFDQGW